MNYNHVTLVGRLVADPELKELKDGGKRAAFTLSVGRPYKNAAGKQESDFLRVVARNKLADVCSEYLSKGRLVLVEGSIFTRSYEKDDAMHDITEIELCSIKFLEPLTKE